MSRKQKGHLKQKSFKNVYTGDTYSITYCKQVIKPYMLVTTNKEKTTCERCLKGVQRETSAKANRTISAFI